MSVQWQSAVTDSTYVWLTITIEPISLQRELTSELPERQIERPTSRHSWVTLRIRKLLALSCQLLIACVYPQLATYIK